MIYEDFVIGSTHPFGAHRFTAEEIRRFALAYDPQPFHLDEAAARESPFGAICASGTASKPCRGRAPSRCSRSNGCARRCKATC